MTLAATALAGSPKYQVLSRDALTDKIKGGWAGQMIGVSYGAPTEFRSNARILREELKWAPDRVENAIHQDDLYVEMTFAKVMDEKGIEATSEMYGEAFKDSKYGLWHANAAARRILNQGIKAPFSGHPQYNMHANDIDFQIEADFIGLMSPGLPRISNDLCDRVGRVMNYGDGLYGGMFVCGMYSAAFFESNPRRVVEAGLACIPEKSQYGLLIKDLLDWSAKYPDQWERVWQMVEDKWDRHDPCPDGARVTFNIDAKINGAYIAFGLLFGGGDFGKTMEISTRCGQDSDCNPSSAAGVLGVMLGFSQIPKEYKSGIEKLADTKFEYTDYSFNSIVDSTMKRAVAAIVKAGGQATDTEVRVKTQTPKPPKLEQWNPGVPYMIAGVKETEWTWGDTWKDENGARVSTQAGDAVSLRFSGTGAAIVGALTQEGGRADIYLDGKKIGVADAYIVENTYDNVLCHVTGLKDGHHVLKLVTIEAADQRSKGHKLAIQKAVLYRPFNPAID